MVFVLMLKVQACASRMCTAPRYRHSARQWPYRAWR